MIKQIETDIDVLTAAKQRIINLFKNGAKVYMSISGGKDSIVMMDIVYKLIQEGRIDKSLLTIVFIDEEVIYDEVIELAETWRKKWIMIGVPVEWYCIEVKHYNCVNSLSDDESYICWDRFEEENWPRRPPAFAIRNHPCLDARNENYQAFLDKRTRDGFQMIGSRTAESVQRLINMSHVKMGNISAGRKFYPIYDWTDRDVWLYLYKNHLDIPITYLQMWQVGVSRRNLRVCNLFAIDTMRSLVRMAEFNPDLMARIEKRQPNAYLAALYFDSEMFGRNTRNRKKLEEKKPEEQQNIDWKREFMRYINDDRNFTNEHREYVRNWYRKRMIGLLKYETDNDDWRRLLEALKTGDTKLRSGRAITRKMKSKYNNAARGK